MKGEFFIIGALLICSLLFFGMGPGTRITETTTADMDRFGENLAKELPHALNIGVNASDPAGTVQNFTEFSRDALEKHGIDLKCYWLVFMPDGGNVNVSVGNFMGSGKTFGINVSGNFKYVYAADGTVNSSLFSVSGYKFDVTIGVDDWLTEKRMLTNKTGIYSLISLERGDGVVRKEILA